MQKEEKRNARRIRLAPPAAGDLSHVPVSVVDLSTSGARIQHDAPLVFQPGKRFLLAFTCDGERFRIHCTVARSRLDIQSSAHRKVYTSGVRFMDVDDDTTERLWGLIGLLAIDVLAHEAAASEEYEFTILH
ncbi:MAG TPA: PilZ domain-containing protein [Thermoanaerobaculia bacterium]|nr:PilZ domain-containing protein [Thermoanaerobaculia bacterium]